MTWKQCACVRELKRELLTLLTCHLYASGERYRLVLYCERDEAAQ